MLEYRFISPLRSAIVAIVLLGAAPLTSKADVPADQAAEMLLNAARKAYNEQNYPFASAKFLEYLQKFSNQPGVNGARYGLALSFIESPERNYEKAIEQLTPLAGNASLPEYPTALYYLALSQRGMALNDLTLAATKQGEEQKQLRARADGRLVEAARQFAAAANAFTAALPKAEVEPKELSKEQEWAARARCDQAEMELRLNKNKEARAATEPFLKNKQLLKSKYRPLGLYYHGFAAFLMQDYLVAGSTLNQVAPFTDPVFGLHARYLMGRIYQLAQESDKAQAMYEATLSDYDRQKKEAVEALKKPELFKNNPHERVRLEALLKNAPDYVAGAAFFSACLLYEAGKFGEALSKFQGFSKEYPKSSFDLEAALRLGYCLVQLKQYPEAINTLTPLVEKNPRLADQVLFWIGKAQVALLWQPTRIIPRCARPA